MSKDFFQRNIELMNDLRTQQFKIKQYLSRGKYRMKQKFFNKGKKHYDFDLNSQEYFHQELYDICFENSQIQENFNNIIMKLLQEPVQYKNQKRYEVEGLPNIRNQSQVRHLLHRFFNNRVYDLQYEKYLVMQRLHNVKAEEEMGYVKSRINLIDKEIQMAISRADRLSCEDYFEETYTLGGKPVPVNENGQSIYKYLDEEDCWFSNIHRDDIIVYARHQLYKRDVLDKYYYPLYYEYQSMVKVYGLDMLVENEEQLARQRQSTADCALRKAKRMIGLFESELQEISPGNLIEKENINSFIFNIFGVEENQLPLDLPLYPAIQLELLENYNQVLPYFFRGVEVREHKELIALMPKFNNFCAILFKYQNKEILEGKQEIKLGLEDDIDIRKELHTMLEEIWVNKYVKVDFDRFNYRYRLQQVDWPLDTLTEEHQRQKRHRASTVKDLKSDSSLRELLNIVKSSNYGTFRKHLKRRSEMVVGRVREKFRQMESVNKYNVLSNEEQTLEHLGRLFRIKFNEKDTNTASVLKDSARLFFESILGKYLVMNPVEIELEEMLRTIKIREVRVKLANLFNGMRAYHRNLALDLRVISGMDFDFQLDDELLINSNKQTFENFQKAVKDTQTYFSRESQEAPLRLSEEEFVQHQTYSRSKLYKKDVVSVHPFGDEVPHVLVSHGRRLKNRIMYAVVGEDMEELEERVLQTCTYFINRYERYIKLKSLDELVDRVELLSTVLELELQYQYEKFRLIEAYYYIYQNTREPLQAYKVSRAIIQLLHQTPKVDFEQTSFAYSYALSTEALREELRTVNHLTEQISVAEEARCRTFHDKFARSLNIPLTLQAYLYGDLQRKAGKGGKLQRMNSLASKISKDSRNREGLRAENEIREQGEEGSEEESFDLENYDEYLLKKNMDAIFEDMMGGDENNPKEGNPVNAVSIENLVVNPRFEGGPHIKTRLLPDLPLTSQRSQNLLNFTELLYVVANLRNLIETLQVEFEAEYGHVSTLYQLGFTKLLTQRMYKACLSPEPSPTRWMPFETDDPYVETVTRCMKAYQETMGPCLEPPSNVQLAMPSTLERHHEKLPPFAALQFLDYHSIDSLLRLRRPANTFRYKQHSLGLNFLELLHLQDRVWRVQLQRRATSRAYQNLARHCKVSLEKSLTEHSLSGQSEVFLATQEVKMYNHQICRWAVMGEAVEEVRGYLGCELADLDLFEKYVQLSKKQLEGLVLMRSEIDRPFLNRRLDKARILAPKDPKDIKKLKTRIAAVVSVRAADLLRHNNYLKLKGPLKVAFQAKWKEVAEGDYEERVEGRERLSPGCVATLCAKYRRQLQLKLLEAYTRDFLQTCSKFLVATETCSLINKLGNYVLSVPFLSKVFTAPNEDPLLDSKVFYDQGRPKKHIPIQTGSVAGGEVRNFTYIYTLEQYLAEWNADNNSPLTHHLDSFDTRLALQGLHPPASKDLIFKWVFGIPDLHIEASQRDAYKHLLRLLHPFTGKLTQSSYTWGVGAGEGPRDKYLSVMKYYKALVEYIEANMLLISLQVEEDILESLESIVRKRVDFQERYFLTDENSIREALHSLPNQDLSAVYNFVVNFAALHQDVQRKVQGRQYLESKEHWAVHDEITDFLMSKVQGYGLLRQSYLPLYEDLQSLRTLSTSPTDYLCARTSNIYRCIHVSSSEAYLNGISEPLSDYHAYYHRLNEWLTHVSRLQDYAISADPNSRVNLNPRLDHDDEEKERFSSGIYSPHSNALVDRLKHVALVPSLDLHAFFQRVVYLRDADEPLSYRHNPFFLLEGISTFKLMGEENRFRLFARIRYHHELGENYLSTRASSLGAAEREAARGSFYELLQGKKSFTLAAMLFSSQGQQGVAAWEVKEAYMEVKEVNQIDTHNLYENLERFKEENKVQFSKGEVALIGRNEGGSDGEHNRVVREVLSLKLLKEEFRFRVLSESIRMLRAERVPKQEAKRIINASLIPRVHLISSYSSPLVAERKSYISQQYKLSFLQAFINRFRNKVSRVDLLSSGYGFVITVPDLEDCVNYMNKLLFTFTEKEFKHRIETFSQYHDILLEAVNDKNRTINEQAALITHLSRRNAHLLQAEYLSKVTKLLHEKTMVQDKLLLVQHSINGLEDRVRRVVQIQYDKKIERLERENEELKAIFGKVKHLHMINTREAAKNDFLDIINYYRDRITDLLNKKVDLSISFDPPPALPPTHRRVPEEDNADKYREVGASGGGRFVTEDLQRCGLGEDILFDPYYATKLINKMRLFNVFKMGSRRLKFEEEQFRKNEQLGELHKIQDSVIAQSEREMLIRGELSKVQEELSRKCLQLERLKQTFDVVENEKTKLKILMQSKEKKIEQKDREIDDLRKKIEERDQAASLHAQEKEKHTEESKDTAKLAVLRKEKKYKKERSAFLTNPNPDLNQTTINLYEKYELSNKDSTWREKCEQLYIENKKLQAELQRYQTAMSSVPQTPKREGMSLNLRNRRQSASESVPQRNEGRFPNISFKYNILKQ